jgi:hypothetical protein
MCRHFRVAMIVGALATPGVAIHAQDAKPAQPSRGEQRQSPPARASGGGDRAVPRAAAPRAEAPRPAPAPRAEAPRPAPAPATSSTTAASGDSSRARPASGRDQSRQRTAPPPDRRGSGDGDRAVARRGSSPRPEGATAGRVHATEREIGGRQSFGTATARRFPPRPGYGGGYYPHWNSWYYPYYPLSYGFFWDPWWGYGYPYGGYGGYRGYGYGYGAGYGYGYGSYGPYPGPTYEIYGGLRLKVKPREAEVFVDGYFAGVVDDFDGAFQQLNLDVGPHRIELRAAGYESISFEIRTQPGEKITYKAELKPVP